MFQRIVGTVLAALGAWALLGDTLLNLAWPAVWVNAQPKSRAALVGVLAILSGIVIAIVSVRNESKRRKRHNIFLDYEVKLTQLEGIVHTSLILFSLESPGTEAYSIAIELFEEYAPKYIHSLEGLAPKAKEEAGSVLLEVAEEIKKLRERTAKINMARIVGNDQLVLPIHELAAILKDLGDLKERVIRSRMDYVQ